MSKEQFSSVALQSKTVDKKLLAVGGVAAVAFAAVLAFAPTTGALSLDNVNLSTGVSSQDGSDEWSSLGLRLATQDGLENLGVGLMGQNVDGDESQSLNLGLEATDDLENLGLGTNLSNVDGDESQQAGIGVQSTDNLDNLGINTNTETKDGNDSTKTNAGLGYEDGLDSLWTGIGGSSVDGDKSSDFGIKFSFDE